MVLRLACGGLCALALASSARAQPPKLGFLLAELAHVAKVDPAKVRPWAAQHGLRIDSLGRVRADVHLQPNADLRAAAAEIAQLGGEVAAVGTSRMDVDAAPRQLASVASAAEVRWVAAPIAPVPMDGLQSAGVVACGADVFHCAGAAGKGVKIAVLDSGFAQWAQSVAAGELPGNLATPPSFGTTHGTACAEIITDMAPQATLLPVAVQSVASLQAWAKQDLPLSGAAIVHHAIGWFGESFGDGTGVLCQIISQSRASGKVWVVAGGNLGGGAVWLDKWHDNNQDGWLEFGNGSANNEFDVPAPAMVQVVLDWNSYPASATDFDLHLCRVTGDDCNEIAASKNTQNGSQPPVEAVQYQITEAGKYAVRVHLNGKGYAGLLRVQLVAGGINLQFARSDRTLADPANCADAFVVSPVPVDNYAACVADPSASQGPTVDGRNKPDVAAPSGVNTVADAAFGGSSAAAAHVSGALALWMEQTGVDAPQAASAVAANATPCSSASPDWQFGAGRLHLPLAVAKVACVPGQVLGCQLPCGVSSTTVCSETCKPQQCAVPDEICDDVDQDCDGKTDEGFACRAGQTDACLTLCNTAGVRACSGTCVWSACVPPKEACNGQDDNCDGATDEGFACAVGSEQGCTVNSLDGTRQCLAGCAWGPCRAPEACNGRDDDGNGKTDDGVACAPAKKGCAAASGPAGDAVAWLVLVLGSAGWVVRRRR